MKIKNVLVGIILLMSCSCYVTAQHQKGISFGVERLNVKTYSEAYKWDVGYGLKLGYSGYKQVLKKTFLNYGADVSYQQSKYSTNVHFGLREDIESDNFAISGELLVGYNVFNQLSLYGGYRYTWNSAHFGLNTEMHFGKMQIDYKFGNDHIRLGYNLPLSKKKYLEAIFLRATEGETGITLVTTDATSAVSVWELSYVWIF